MLRSSSQSSWAPRLWCRQTSPIPDFSSLERVSLLGRELLRHVVHDDHVVVLLQPRLEHVGRPRHLGFRINDAGQRSPHGPKRLLLEAVPAEGDQDANLSFGRVVGSSGKARAEEGREGECEGGHHNGSQSSFHGVPPSARGV